MEEAKTVGGGSLMHSRPQHTSIHILLPLFDIQEVEYVGSERGTRWRYTDVSLL